MPPRPAISQLPDAVLTELNQRLISGGFSDYSGLSDWLKAQGFQVSRTSVGDYGKDLKASMEKSIMRARERMEIAKALGGMSNEEKAALLEASEMVAIDQMMDVLESMQGWEMANKATVIPKLARAIADIGRSAIGSAKWRKDFEVEAKRQAREEAAKQVDEMAKAAGFDDEQARFWREKVLMGGV